jgi:hypothetical protein
MGNLTNWAMRQIDTLEVTDEKKEQYKKVLEAFSEQGHSGSTAPYALGYINKYIEEGYEAVKESLDKLLENSKKEEKEDDIFGDMQTVITNNILEIIDLFREYKFGTDEANKLRRLMDWKPIVQLTGSEEEWGEPDKYNGKVAQQNKVCSAVFRDNFDNSTAHYLYGRVYSDNGGHTWFTTNRKPLESSIPVTFPFEEPDKPEYVYLNGEDSTEIITDKSRIKELYDEFEERVKNS